MQRNGSILTVFVEVQDVGGVRNIAIYTPYWIVTSSPMIIHYQHDTSAVQSGAASLELENQLNGVDGLCADQLYKDYRKKESKANIFSSSRYGALQHKSSEALQRVRGFDGIKLGPEYPMRGLADILRVPEPRIERQVNCLLHKPKPVVQSSSKSSKNIHFAVQKAIRNCLKSTDAVNYKLTHCGYTNEERK